MGGVVQAPLCHTGPANKGIKGLSNNMTRLIVEIFRWFGRKFITLVVIVCVLLGMAWLSIEYEKIKSDRDQADAIGRIAQNQERQLAPLYALREQKTHALRETTQAVENTRILFDQAKSAERHAGRHLEAVIAQKRWYFTPLTHGAYFARLTAARLAFDSAEKLSAETQFAYRSLHDALTGSTSGRALRELNEKIETKKADIALLNAKQEQYRDSKEAHVLERVQREVAQVMPMALLIVAAIILLPLVLRSILYFLVAPAMSQAQPVQIFPNASGEATISSAGISVPIELASGDELLVHSDYLQSAGVGPGKKTRFLFSWRIPLTSLAAGLFLMVAIRNPGHAPTLVSISPKRDLFDKLAHVTLPTGAAMVVYPRSLVGAVLRGGETPEISRHWRLGSLHSWLTFQFRYLVVHGPCDIVLKGCRGVRAGEVTPENARMQDQCATLGFTANLAYSAIRCETLIDYLRGRDGLFNDRFADANGYHFTEEIPDPRRRSGLFGRGPEGLIDSVLKGFGI